MITISFIYGKQTHESTIDGGLSDYGFYEYGGWEYSLNNPEIIKDIDNNPELYMIPWKPTNLRDAIKRARDLGICQASGSDIYEGTWWSSVDSLVNFETGEETHYSMHVDGASVGVKRCINRLLNL